MLEKKLPKVFANKVNKNAGNNENVFYSDRDSSLDISNDLNSNYTGKNVMQKINDIFNSPNYIYKADVIIELRDRTVNKRIVGKNNLNLITIENELIPISEIVDIKKK